MVGAGESGASGVRERFLIMKRFRSFGRRQTPRGQDDNISAMRFVEMSEWRGKRILEG